MVKAWRITCAGVLLCALAGCTDPVRSSAASVPLQQTVKVATAIETIVATGRHPFGQLDLADREQLKALYEPVANAPIWIDAFNRPSPTARDALVLLSGAADEGFDPGAYNGPALEGIAAVLSTSAEPTVSDLATFDTALTINTLRYFRQLHRGRVDPRAIGFKISVPPDRDDYVALLRSAVANHRIAETATELAPPLVLYRGLRRQLTQYRVLAADRSLLPLPAPVATVHPGERYAGLLALYQRLVALGDLPATAPPATEPPVYNGALIEGVKHFQLRHGLQSDGVLGAGTQAALAVPLSWRVRQIELAMERLRWLPHLGDEPFLAVNIPMFHLWGWDSIRPNGVPSFGTGVIVGRALNTKTPVLVEDMRYIVFRPYWNVPPSILRHEMLPILERDFDYLDRQNLEIVSGQGDDALPVPATAESLAQLRAGILRLRQRPGPKNSLGLIKFIFPNDENVYMHGTPAQELFSRSRRDFSHGCVRLEDPIALAEWTLKDQPGWTRERIVAAMNATQSSRVSLTRPIRVILFYVTAVVMPEDGTIRFAEDIYGHDATLDRGLARQQTIR